MWRVGVAAGLLLLLAAALADMLWGSHRLARALDRTVAPAGYATGVTPDDADARPLREQYAGDATGAGTAHDDWTSAVRQSIANELVDHTASPPATKGGRLVLPEESSLDRLSNATPAPVGQWPSLPVDSRHSAAHHDPAQDSVAVDREATPADVVPPRPRPAAKPASLRQARQIQDAQRLLAGLGYHPGPVDGQSGRMTDAAVRAFQRDTRLPVDGTINGTLLAHLDAQTRERSRMRQQELEAMAPAAPPQHPAEQKERGIAGTVLGGLQRLVGHNFNSAERPEEIAEYCQANADTWIYDFGEEVFVHCGHVNAARAATRQRTETTDKR